MSNNCLVQVHDVSKQYLLGKTTVDALRSVSADIHRGEFLAIAGPSGSGKTTLLNLIGCIDEPSSGSIVLDGVRIDGQPPHALAKVRNSKIGFIFQSFNLIPVLNSAENIEYPLLFQRVEKSERRRRVYKALEDVGLSSFARHRPDELSGGQRQRVSIARALVTQPALVLADEPTANLDSGTGSMIIDLMQRINTAAATTFVFSTHDHKIIGKAHRVVEIVDGRIKPS